MTRRIVAAVVRMDLIRARKTLLWGGGLALAATIAALTLDGGAAIAAAFVVGVTLFSTTMFAPMSTLLVEKLLGTMELDRTLPVPLRVLATARVIAASLRTVPMLLLLGTVAVVVSRETAAVPVSTLVFAVFALQLLYWSGLWVSYGLLARFDFKKLMWLPAALWFVAVFAPDSLVDPLTRALVERITILVTAALADPARLPALGLVLLGVAALCFSIALALVVSGLRRFQPNPLALQGVVEAVPREELTPVRRGPIVAIMRLKLRLATPQMRRELAIVAAMVAVLLADANGVSALSGLAGLANVYLPVLAFLMPGAIGIQLLPARQLGTIEGLQQLPCTRRDVALGHLLTILLLAVPAVTIWAVAKIIEGGPVDGERIARLWAAMSAFSWLTASLAVWATQRRLVIAAALVIGVPAALFFGGRWLLPLIGVDLSPQLAAMFAYWNANVSWLRPTVTLVAFVAAVGAGLAMFTHGLRTYQQKVS